MPQHELVFTKEVPPPFPTTDFEPMGRRLLLRCIEGNILYIASALLMMLGCYQLMRSRPDSGGDFAHTVQTLAIMHGYEWLVVLTAGFLARRFRVLGDAFTLFVIELVLMFDPTYFSNAVLTLRTVEDPAARNITLVMNQNAVLVNAIGLLLVPVKLYLLAKWLDLHISIRAVAGLLAAATVVYFGQLPMNFTDFDAGTWYYALGWAPLLVALLLPAVHATAAAGERMSESQARWLRWLLVLVPLGITGSHYVQGFYVYHLNLQAPYLAAWPLVVAAFLIKRYWHSGSRIPMGMIDVLAAFSLLFGLSPLSAEDRPGVIGEITIPATVAAGVPSLVAMMAVVVTYVVLWWGPEGRRDRRALARLAVVGAAAVVKLFIESGLAGYVVGEASKFVIAVMRFIIDHRQWSAIFVWAIFLYLALRCPSFWTHLLCTLLGIGGIAWLAPGPLRQWIPEAVQACCAATLILIHVHRMKPNVGDRAGLVLLMIVVGWWRWLLGRQGWQLAVVGFEAGALLAAGWMLRERVYMVLGLMSASLGGFVFYRSVRHVVSGPYVVIALGLIVFAGGVILSFCRERILAQIRWTVPETQPAPPVSNSQNSSTIAEPNPQSPPEDSGNPDDPVE